VNVVVKSASTEGASKAPKAPCEIDRGATDGRRNGEPNQSGDERPLASHNVPDAATEEEQAAEGKRVGGDNPLAVGVGEVQGVLRCREGDVDDGAVQNDHQLSDPQHSEDPPPPVVIGRFNRDLGPTGVLHRHQSGHRMLHLCTGPSPTSRCL
jgi:hypothetical protein